MLTISKNLVWPRNRIGTMYVLKENKRKIKINKQKGNKQTKINKTKLKKKFIRTSDILCSMTSNICHVIFYVLMCLIKENPVQYF
jgi:hypothetical protein